MTANPLSYAKTDSRRDLWVFAADLDEADQAEFIGNGVASAALIEALGATPDTDHVVLVDLDALSDYGFATYLTDACGMSEASVAPDADTLNALSGTALLVYSHSFAGREGTLAPKPPLSFVGRYHTGLAPLDILPTTLPAESEGVSADKRKPVSDAAMSGRIAMVALLLMAALVGLMIFVAG